MDGVELKEHAWCHGQIRYLVLHFADRLSCTSNADIASVVVTWIPATDHPVAGCSESCFTFHCLMMSTAPRYCSTYVFLVLNIFKIAIQNCRFSFTRYTVLQSHARPISVSHRYRQSVQCIHSRLNVWETCDQMSGDYMSAIKWHAINCLNDYVSTLLIVQRLTVPRLTVRESW